MIICWNTVVRIQRTTERLGIAHLVLPLDSRNAPEKSAVECRKPMKQPESRDAEQSANERKPDGTEGLQVHETNPNCRNL